ncbi:lipopolysaccharide assembly protein LapA domain-containing protein [Labrys wisconsinensis]|uniref:Integral membrane protein n=1 Tax=Labrys wisconsinensis TaxID=425677 RepID=A0ABU0J1L0_9HYPH|nr:lipopolysaccharide assembly protein LapA domain-containing protein [Labrys wisconsinensis]MDQ0468143.1 putative integral membrane protein [Labrys wisconsinensis]
MKRFVLTLVFAPIAILVLLFAVANRQLVTLSLDPFNAAAPALTFRAPLFLVLFAVLMVGVVVGGAASWLKQGRHRRAARKARAEAERLRAEADRLRDQVSGVEPAPHRTLPAPVPF